MMKACETVSYVKLFGAVAVSVLAPLATLSKTCTWTGGGADGKWGTPANWGGSDASAIPADNDDVILSNGGSSPEIVNDIPNLTLRTLTYSGSKSLRLSGEHITLAGSSTKKTDVRPNGYQALIQNVKGATITNDVPLTFTGNSRMIEFYGHLTVTKPVTNLDSNVFYMLGRVNVTANKLRFTDVVYMPNGTISLQGHMNYNTIYFDDALTAKNVIGDCGQVADATGKVVFNSDRICVGTLLCSYSRFACGVPNSLGSDAVVKWSNYADYWTHTDLDLSGNDLEIDRTYSGDFNYFLCREFTTSSEATLKLNSTVTTIANCMYNGKLSIVYNPTDSAYSHTVTQSVSTTTGKITVSNGTFRVARDAKMLQFSELEVADGARFEYLADDAIELPNLVKITLGKDSQLVLPSGTEIAVRNLVVDGVCTNGINFTHADIPQISEGVTISAGETLTINVDSGVTKSISEALTAEELADVNANRYLCIVKTGAGTLNLDQSLSYAAKWHIRGGTVNVTAAENALGVGGVLSDSFSEVVIDYAVSSSIIFSIGTSANDVYVAKPIRTVGEMSDSGGFRINGNVYLNGLLTAGGTFQFTLYSQWALHLNGGMSQPRNKQIWMAAASGKIYIENVPIDVGSFFPIWVTIYVNVPGNKMNFLRLQDNACLVLGCDDAFVGSPVALTMLPRATGIPNVNLNGHDLCTSNLTLTGVCSQTPDSMKNSVYIQSDSLPGTLSFVQGARSTNSVVIVRGKVSLVKGGAAEYAFNRDILSTGSLTVTGGVFAMTANASWANCTNVTVSGSGAVVSIAKGGTFGVKSSVRIFDGGKMAINGVTTEQSVKRLFFGDRGQRAGTWGSTLSGAQFKDDEHFTGEGVLRVLSEGGCMLLIK